MFKQLCLFFARLMERPDFFFVPNVFYLPFRDEGEVKYLSINLKMTHIKTEMQLDSILVKNKRDTAVESQELKNSQLILTGDTSMTL